LDFFSQKTMKTISITSQFSVFGSLQELPDDIQNMMEQAVAVRKKSIYPIQNSVGAALLLDNGQTVLGSNQAYPSGLCAERAIFQAGAIYPEAKILKWLLPQLPTQ
jgi:cytidine deaminase